MVGPSISIGTKLPKHDSIRHHALKQCSRRRSFFFQMEYVATCSEGGAVVDVGRLAEGAVGAADVVVIAAQDDVVADNAVCRGQEIDGVIQINKLDKI